MESVAGQSIHNNGGEPVKNQIKNPEVAAVFNSYPEIMRDKLLYLRQLIYETAQETKGVGELEETLKWGEPSYLTPKTKSGSTVRIDWKQANESQYAIYFKCTTNLVETFKAKYPTDFKYGGNRCILFDQNDKVPAAKLKDCIALALTYHLNKKSRRKNNT